jgi:hypothetical protein
MHYALIGLLAIFLSGIFTRVNTFQEQTSTKTEATAISGNMMVYRSYVTAYAVANSTVTGTIADSALSLPTWYNRITSIQNYIEAGKGYVYFSVGNQSDLAYAIVKLGNQAINAGSKTNGILVNPMSTTNYVTPLSLPAAIPEGSVVIAP